MKIKIIKDCGIDITYRDWTDTRDVFTGDTIDIPDDCVEVEDEKPAKKYVCPQCGADSNGSDIHQLTHHTLPPYSVAEAKAYISRRC